MIIISIIFTWCVLAIFLGVFSTFFTKKFNIENAKCFDKISQRIRSPYFKNVVKFMAEETVSPVHMLNIRIVGIIFIVIGFFGLIQCLTSPQYFIDMFSFGTIH